MTAYKGCTSIGGTFSNLGNPTCTLNNVYGSFSGVILTTSGFSFETMAAASVADNYNTGVKAGTVFPLLGTSTYEDNSTEPTYSETDAEQRKRLRGGQYRFKFSFDLPMRVHQALQSYRNGDLRVFLVDENGSIYGTRSGDTFKGFAIQMINPEKQKWVPSSSDTPAYSDLSIDLASYKEWDENGDLIPETSWANSLESLTDVSLEQVSASSSEVVVRVFSDGGFNDGVQVKVPIIGIDCTVSGDNDFDTSGIGTATTIVDSGDGNYKISGTGLTAGDVDLNSASTMTTDGLLISSIQAATITI